MRATIDIPDEAYNLAKAIASDRNETIGQVVGDLILKAATTNAREPAGSASAYINMSAYGFPTFRCKRVVTTDDVRVILEEESTH
jgi:hypothetical protein